MHTPKLATVAVLLVLAACGGQLAPDGDPPVVADPGASKGTNPPPSKKKGSTEPSPGIDPQPTPAPGKPLPAPAPSDPPQPMSPAPKDVPCALGGKAEVTYAIPEAEGSRGSANWKGTGYCTATVTFRTDGKMTKISSAPWVGPGPAPNVVEYNGISMCERDPQQPQNPHCGTLTYPSGKVVERYCTLFAACVDGHAHGVGFTW